MSIRKSTLTADPFDYASKAYYSDEELSFEEGWAARIALLTEAEILRISAEIKGLKNLIIDFLDKFRELLRDHFSPLVIFDLCGEDELAGRLDPYYCPWLKVVLKSSTPGGPYLVIEIEPTDILSGPRAFYDKWRTSNEAEASKTEVEKARAKIEFDNLKQRWGFQ